MCVSRCVHLVILLLARVVFLQPVSQWAVLKGASDAVLNLYFSQCLRLRDHLHHTWPAVESQQSAGQPTLQDTEWMMIVLYKPRPRPVEQHLNKTILMSRPSWIQILFMMRIICRVNMSCRRSSPD